MMFADERAVHKQAGMAVDAVETQDRMLAGVIGRDGERLPVGERLVVLDGIALHSRLAGNLYLVPLAIRGIPELPGSTQQDGRRFDTGQFLQDRIGGFIGKPPICANAFVPDSSKLQPKANRIVFICFIYVPIITCV